MNKACEQLEKAIKVFAAEARERVAETDAHSFRVNISIEGRAQDGELKIEFEIGGSYEPGRVTEAGNLHAAMTEYLRRKGWQQRYAPQCLPSPEPSETLPLAPDTEAPF